MFSLKKCGFLITLHKCSKNETNSKTNSQSYFTTEFQKLLLLLIKTTTKIRSLHTNFDYALKINLTLKEIHFNNIKLLLIIFFN